MGYAAVYVALCALILWSLRTSRRLAEPDPDRPARRRLLREVRRYGPCGYLGHVSDCTCDRGDGFLA